MFLGPDGVPGVFFPCGCLNCMNQLDSSHSGFCYFCLTSNLKCERIFLRNSYTQPMATILYDAVSWLQTYIHIYVDEYVPTFFHFCGRKTIHSDSWHQRSLSLISLAGKNGDTCFLQYILNTWREPLNRRLTNASWLKQQHLSAHWQNHKIYEQTPAIVSSFGCSKWLTLKIDAWNIANTV